MEEGRPGDPHSGGDSGPLNQDTASGLTASFAAPERSLPGSFSVPGSGLTASLTATAGGLTAPSAETPSGSTAEELSETPAMVTSGRSYPSPGKNGATSYIDITDVSDGVIPFSSIRAVRDHISLLQAQPGELGKEGVMTRCKAFLRKLHAVALSRTNLLFLRALRKEFGWDHLGLDQFIHKELLNPGETPKSPKKPPPRKVVNWEPEPSTSMMYRDVRISLGTVDDPAKVSAGRQSDPYPPAKEVPVSELYHGMDPASPADLDAITGTVTCSKKRRSYHSPIRAPSPQIGSPGYFNVSSSIAGILGEPEDSSMYTWAPESAAAPPSPSEPMEVKEESATNPPSDVRVVVVAAPLQVDSSWAQPQATEDIEEMSKSLRKRRNKKLNEQRAQLAAAAPSDHAVRRAHVRAASMPAKDKALVYRSYLELSHVSGNQKTWLPA